MTRMEPLSPEATVQALMLAVEAKQPLLRRHSERVAWLAAGLARQLELPEREVAIVRLAGLVHDVGKAGIADEILHKPALLSDAERLLVQSHVQTGLRTLETAHFPQEGSTIVAQHHERLDGSGYPAGLGGLEIVLGARILAVADVFEAMTADRPYRRACAQEQALAYLEGNSGKRYDSKVVEALWEVVRHS